MAVLIKILMESIRGKDLFILGDILDSRSIYQLYGTNSYSTEIK